MQRNKGKDSFNSENDNQFWLKEIGEKNQNIYGLSVQVRNLLEKLNDSLKTEIELQEKLVVSHCEKTQCAPGESLLESYIKINENEIERLQFEENTQRKKDEDILDKNVKRFWLKEIREKTPKINSLSVMVQDLDDKLNHSLKRKIELQEKLAVSQCEKNQCAQDKSLLENYIKTKENNCKRLQEELVYARALHSKELAEPEDMRKKFMLSMQEDFNKRLEENKSELEDRVKELQEKLKEALKREMELLDKLFISNCENAQDKTLLESYVKTKENNCERLQEELVDPPALHIKALTGLEDVHKEVPLSMQEDFNKRLEEECKKNKSELDKQVKDLQEKLNDALQREMELHETLVISQSEKTQCAQDKSLLEISLKTKENDCDRLQEELVYARSLYSKELAEPEDMPKEFLLSMQDDFNKRLEENKNELEDRVNELQEKLNEALKRELELLDKLIIFKCENAQDKTLLESYVKTKENNCERLQEELGGPLALHCKALTGLEDVRKEVTLSIQEDFNKKLEEECKKNKSELERQVKDLQEKLNDALQREMELQETLVISQSEKTQCAQDKSLREISLKTRENDCDRLQEELAYSRALHSKELAEPEDMRKEFMLSMQADFNKRLEENKSELEDRVKELQEKPNEALKKEMELLDKLFISNCENAQDKTLFESYGKTKENNCERLQEELVDPPALHSKALTGLEDVRKEVTLSMQEDFNKKLEEECKKNKSELERQVKDLQEKLNDALQREMELQDTLVISRSEKTHCLQDKSMLESSLKTKENNCDRLQEELVDLPALHSKALTELEDVFKESKLEKQEKTFNHKVERLDNEHMASEKVEEMTDIVLNLKTYMNTFMLDLLTCTSVVTKPKKLNNSFVLDLKKRYIEGDKQTQMTKKTEGAYQFEIDHLKKKIEFHERIHQTPNKTNIHMKRQPEKTIPLMSVKQFVNIQSNNYQARRVHESKKKLDAYDYTSVYRIQNRTNKFVEQKPERNHPFKQQPNSQEPKIPWR